MRTRVKICCISSLLEARAAIAAGADALGLVAAMPSGPGVIGDDLIAAISPAIPPPVASFLLTSSTTAEEIADHARLTGANTVQAVCHIEPREHAGLARLLPLLRRVQVIHIEDEGTLRLIDIYAPYVHAFLLDSGRPAASVPEFGGTGRVHDWKISAEFVSRSPLPVFLAGGLNAGNIGAAIKTVRPYAVDLCSGVRTNGALDAEKLRAFMQAVHDADRR